VHLTPEAIAVFEAWQKGKPVQASGLVFPAPRSRGYLNDDYLRKVVGAAMGSAGIEKVDKASGRPRKPLHSLRATFTRRQLEAGKHPQWVEAQLGHSSLTLTIGVYGAWSEPALRAEAAREPFG
jgi:integrase